LIELELRAGFGHLGLGLLDREIFPAVTRRPAISAAVFARPSNSFARRWRSVATITS
jgi:hypothetical protein